MDLSLVHGAGVPGHLLCPPTKTHNLSKHFRECGRYRLRGTTAIAMETPALGPKTEARN